MRAIIVTTRKLRKKLWGVSRGGSHVEGLTGRVSTGGQNEEKVSTLLEIVTRRFQGRVQKLLGAQRGVSKRGQQEGVSKRGQQVGSASGVSIICFATFVQ